jgi:hypothetical protein
MKYLKVVEASFTTHDCGLDLWMKLGITTERGISFIATVKTPMR